MRPQDLERQKPNRRPLWLFLGFVAFIAICSVTATIWWPAITGIGR